MASKLCDSCKSATAALYCRADSAFLCTNCDSRVHAANKLASRHARVWICEVCEQAPAHVTCKADAAALCVTCDRDIHSANPLARRHERVPVTPFYDFVAVSRGRSTANFLDERCFSDGGDEVSREEEEAASWLLPNPNPNPKAAVESLFSDIETPYLDLDYVPVDPKSESQEQNSSGTDGVVPVHSKSVHGNEHCYDMEFVGSKQFSYGFNCISQSVSSSSVDVGVVPDGCTMVDVSNPYGRPGNAGTESVNQAPVVQLSSAEREARVMRYREKRKNRKFEKTIRYASRKAYAEMRPRIKGRFAKRSEVEVEVEADPSSVFGGFGVVPTF